MLRRKESVNSANRHHAKKRRGRKEGGQQRNVNRPRNRACESVARPGDGRVPARNRKANQRIHAEVRRANGNRSVRIRAIRLLAVVLPALLLLAGCWDRLELNERALWLGTALDAAEEGKIQVSGQIVVPLKIQTPAAGTGGGGTGEPFIVVTQTGENIGDILQDIQAKLPREVFFGQRRVIIVGEELAKNGLRGILDNTTRLSEAPFRTDLFVVKGKTAHELIKLRGSLEAIPVFSALKKHERSGGRGETTFLDFLIAANRSGIAPTVPTGELVTDDDMKPKTFFQLSGVAVFDDELKLAGYMNLDEDRDLLWILNKLHKITLATVLKDGDASAQFLNLSSKVKPSRRRDGTWHFDITLRGDGNLIENNSSLDAGNKKELQKIERELEKAAAKHMEQTIRKAQEQIGLDMFGFGVIVHQKYPREWPKLKDHWNEEFKRATFRVEADFDLERPGLSGRPAT